MLQDKNIKKIQELKADFTTSRVSVEDIFSRFKALKLSEGLSQFKWFKTRGYDFKMVLAILVSMVVSSYRDGKSSIPLDFSLHREKGKKAERPFGMTRKELKRQYSRNRIKDSYTAKRVGDWTRIRFRWFCGCSSQPFIAGYELKGALCRSMKADVLRETLDRRLWGCSTS